MPPTPWQGVAFPWPQHPEWPADYEFASTPAPRASPPAYLLHEGSSDAVTYKYKGAYGGGKAHKVFFSVFRWVEGGRVCWITRQDMAYAFSKLVGDWERVLLALHDVQVITAANKRSGRQPSPDTQARHLAVVAWVSGVAEQAFWSIEHLSQHLDALSRAELTGAIPSSFAPSPDVGDYVLRCAHREPAPAGMNSYAFAVCADVVRRARGGRPDAASDAGLGLLDEEIMHLTLARAGAAVFGVLKEIVDERQLGELRRAREAVPKVRRTNFAKRWSEKRPPPTPPALPAHEHALLMQMREDAALVALGASPATVSPPTLSSGSSVSSEAGVPSSPRSPLREAPAAVTLERATEHAPIYGALMRKADERERDDAPPAPPLKSPSFAFGRY